MRRPLAVLAVLVAVLAAEARAQCGGVERWAVKMAADPAASQLSVQSAVVTTLDDLVRLTRPTLPSDEVTRAPGETSIRTVDARLVRFKREGGRDGDSDYHLVFTDATMLYTGGGNSVTVSPHSFIGEIPDPACVAGRHGNSPTPSRFATEMQAVRQAFESQFPNRTATGWNDAQGIPVRVTGVVFFDRPHGQVGRALNGIELHPILSLQFNPPAAPAPAPAAAPTVTLSNSGFENGSTGWTATANVITTSNQVPAHGGTGKAWLGGWGTLRTDRLSRQITLPATTNTIALSTFMYIETDEETQNAFDRLTIRVRRANGQTTALATFSNAHAAPGYVQRSFDLSAFNGQTITIEFESREDNGSATSFVIDDVTIVIAQ
jgi:hypothetical protein